MNERRIMTKNNQYEESWKLYKTHSDFFEYDFDYYYQFAKDKKTLEAFAGYGRLSNFLQSKNINLYANELSPDLASFIKIPPHKIHIGDFLEFKTPEKFERIIIAYNSFCLITEEEKAKEMFSKIENILQPAGMVSLSYYHPDFWPDSNIYEFNCDGDVVKYHSDFNLSNREQKKGIWEDIYEFRGRIYNHKYNVRVYENRDDLNKIMAHTRLRIVDEIKNYNDKRIVEEGWTEYVLQRN